MKKLLLTAIMALAALSILSSCASFECNMCGKNCSDKYSYKDGEVVLCSSCYKDCFKEKTEVNPDSFFEDLSE